MKGLLELLLPLVCTAVGWGIVGVPLYVFGLRRNRAAPEHAARGAIPWAIGIGAWSGLVVSVIGFMWGANVGDESAGEIAAALFSIACFGGTPLCALLAWFIVVRRARAPLAAPGRELREQAPDEAAQLKSGRRLQVLSIALLVTGALSSIAGLLFSLSLGLISLALAINSVRPIASAFLLVHAVLAALSYRAAHQLTADVAVGRARVAFQVNVVGSLLATLIAAAGPEFFQRIFESSMKLMLR